MSTFLKDLAWREHPEDFSWAEQRILLALSNKRWEWRTVDNLKAVVRLPESEYHDALASLMEDGLVRGWITDDWQPILGLAERVGRGARPIKDRRLAYRN